MFEDLLDHWYSYSRKKFWGPLILIFIFSVILALSIVGVIYLINPNLLEATNSYSIQKEVCKNETIDITGETIQKINDELDYLRTRYKELGCDILERYDSLDESLSCELLNKDIKNKTEYREYLWFGEITETKETCTYEGVEEIVNENYVITANIEMNEYWIIVKGNMSLKSVCEGISNVAVNKSFCKMSKEIISKSQLTEEFLRNNCECTHIKLNRTPGCSNCDYSIQDLENITWWNKDEHTCVKYQCSFGQTKYLVEVN